jgi:hypothetical protein
MNGLVSVLSLALVSAWMSAPAPAFATPSSASPCCEDAYLGVYVVTASAGGAEVTRLMDGSPAEKAGVHAGDRIVALGGTAIADADALIAGIEARSAGERVELVLFRGDDKRILTLALGNRAEAPDVVQLSDVTINSPLPGLVRVPAAPLKIDPALLHTQTPRLPSVWLPEQVPPAVVKEAGERRLRELSARTDERWAELYDRLEEFRRWRGSDDGMAERVEALRRDMKQAHAEQQKRLDEFRASVRERRRVAAPPARAGAPILKLPSPWPIPAMAPDAPATASEVRALHDEVRALRKEIAELRELLSGAR